jgi:hypothetical protein
MSKFSKLCIICYTIDDNALSRGNGTALEVHFTNTRPDFSADTNIDID